MSDTPEFDIDDTSSEEEARLIAEARELIVDGERAQALSKVQDALRLNKSNTDALWMFATLTKDVDKAKAALKRLLSLDPENDKASKMLNKLESAEDDELFGDSKAKEDEQSKIMKEMLKQQQALLEKQSQQPVINITNTAANTNTMNQAVGGAMAAGVNQTALIIGFLVAIFLGIFGMAHLLNGKIGTGILYWILGWVIWFPLMVVIAATGIGACFVIPLHIWVSYSQAKSGATYA